MKRWLVNRTNPEYVEYISRVASVSPAFAQILINRGIKSPDQLYAFLDPSIDRLSDPFELPNIKIAIDRIKEAKKNNEIVLVCGDYDADGITATAIIVEGLKKIGVQVHYFIPNRMTHGYGFGRAGIEKAKEIGAKLIITVDCGITSFDAVSDANSIEIDVIITDHHEPTRQNTEERARSKEEKDLTSDFILPDALAIINPKLLNSSVFTHHLSILSGSGVAFMLIYALLGSMDDAYELLDLAAIGTVADVVPVFEDNRIIIKEGIKLIQSGSRIGIKALKSASGIKSDYFKTSFLYYILNPRINAAGRISDANDVVRLLTTKSEAEAEELAKWLNNLNLLRQEIELAVYNDAKDILSRGIGKEDLNCAIVLAKEGWHPGVIGIVASRIAEEYCMPTFIFSIDNGIAKGSARSIPFFDIYYGLTQCKQILKRFGGHKQAAGLSLSVQDVEQFSSMISDVIRNTLSEDELIPVLNIDAAVNLYDVKMELLDEIQKLEPFGYGNDDPLFGTRGLEVIQPRIVGNNHLKMLLRQNRRSIDSIGFDFGGLLNIVEDNKTIDAAFVPAVNEWNGGRHLQLNLKAIRPAVSSQ